MAHLTDRSGRGQIIIVAAFAMAVLFVALALILNSAIFTENLASRGETTGGEEAADFRSALQGGIAEIVTYENRRSHADHTALRAHINGSIRNLSAALIDNSARFGSTSNVTITSFTDGTRLNQSTLTRELTNVSGTANWTLASGVDQTRGFEITVDSSQVDSCTADSLEAECFRANVTDGSTSLGVSFESSGSDVNVVVVDNSGPTFSDCGTYNTATVSVNLTAGTVQGENCSALSFSDAPNDDYAIDFENGDRAAGRFNLTVDNASVSSSSSHVSTTSGEPRATRALYDITVGYDYQTSNLKLDAKRRFAPGEPE